MSRVYVERVQLYVKRYTVLKWLEIFGQACIYAIEKSDLRAEFYDAVIDSFGPTMAYT